MLSSAAIFGRSDYLSLSAARITPDPIGRVNIRASTYFAPTISNGIKVFVAIKVNQILPSPSIVILHP